LLTLAAGFSTVNAATPTSTKDGLLCPAELLVLQADSKRFNNQKTSALEKSGLKRRMLTALATLPELCRRYQAAENGIDDSNVSLIQKIRDLQLARSELELRSLHQRIEPVLKLAPFSIDIFQITTENRVVEAGKIYQEYCASCHQHPNTNTANPAYSLHDMAREQEEPEFLARMLLGVKGTPEIGLSNPLTPSEIGAMRTYFLLHSD